MPQPRSEVRGRARPRWAGAEGLREARPARQAHGQERGVLVARCSATGIFRSTVRAQRSAIQHPSAAPNYLEERRQSVSRASRSASRTAGLSAGAIRQQVPRPARADQPRGLHAGVQGVAKAGEVVGPERRPNGVRLAPEPSFVRARSRWTRWVRSPARSASAAAEAGRRRCSSLVDSAAAAKATRARSRPTGWSRRALSGSSPTGASAVANRPVDEARSRRSPSLPDLQPEGRRGEAELPVTAAQGQGPRTLLNQSDRRRAIRPARPSSRCIAEGRAQRRDRSTPFTRAGVHRLNLDPRWDDLPQRRPWRRCLDGTAGKRSRCPATRGSIGRAT